MSKTTETNLNLIPDFTSGFDEAKNYHKLETNVSKKWLFVINPDTVKTAMEPDVDDKGVPKLDKAGNEKRRFRVTFTQVIDIESKEQRPKEFSTTSSKLSEKLRMYFNKGKFCLDITRVGQGYDTDYEIIPIDNPK